MGILRCIILLIWVLFVTQQATGQTSRKWIKTAGGKKVKVEKLERLIQATMDSLGVAGLSIAIINDAELAYYRTFGFKNLETKTPVDGNTLFEGASLSKPLFAYFFLKMVEQGAISLDTPLYKYLPHPGIKDNDKRYELITPRMVLSHTTGFPNWSVNKPVEIAFTPGTGFSYSGEAHQYLTASLAVHMKINWQEQLDSVFQKVAARPLGMQHSFYVRNEFTGQNKATGYYKDGAPKGDWLTGSKSFGAAHTLHSEALDYSKFLLAMIKEEGLQKETFDMMLREHIHFTKENEQTKLGQTGWCLGFAMRPTRYGMRYMHTGNNTGFQSYCCFYRERKYGLVFFTNSEKAFELYRQIGTYLEDGF